MAEKVQNVSGLLAAMGNRLTQVQAEHRGKEVNLGRPELPGGIEGGIAQLVSCRIGKFEKGDNIGKPFFDAAATVMVPNDVNGRPCRGLQTRIGPEPLCDTPKSAGKRKTFSEHYKWFRDQLIGLGFNIDGLQGTPQQIEAQILAGLEQLKKSKPFIHFRTSQLPGTTIEKDAAGKWWVLGGPPPGKKGPYASEEMLKKANPNAGGEGRVYHEWNGLAADFDPSSIAEAGSHDNSPRANGQAAPAAVVEAAAEPEAPSPPADEQATEDVGEQPPEQVDLQVLCEAAKADGEGPEAAQLTTIALDAGITDKQIEAAASWDEVLALVEAALGVGGDSASAAEEAPEPPPEPEQPPTKGKVFKFKLLGADGKPTVDAKTKKEKKPVDVEVITVDGKSKTCTVKDLAAGKPVVDPKTKLPLRIKWTDLIS